MFDAITRLADHLWQAVKDNEADMVQSLLDEGADPNHQLYWRKDWKNKDKKNEMEMRSPPLHTACKNGSLEIVKMLVQRGANMDKGGGKSNWTPLHYACNRGCYEVVVYLTKEVGCNLGEFFTTLKLYML